MTNEDGWDLGPDIKEHLLEIDEAGTVLQFIDLDKTGKIIEASPTQTDQYGALDHPPLDMKCNWSTNMFSTEQFEKLCVKATE